jgi:hypothetical protein
VDERNTERETTMKYSISITKKTFTSGSVALDYAQAQYPTAVWGKWHQGPNGKVRIVGRVPGRETDDPIVIERVK